MLACTYELPMWFSLCAADKTRAMQRWHAGDLWLFKASEYSAAYSPADYGRFKAATDFYAVDYAEVGSRGAGCAWA